ncbi:MAG: hypothetical protein HS126_22920 [Anaerolineales bacterium]|nr:hypothetical protein [Anaerolineales bacterium]
MRFFRRPVSLLFTLIWFAGLTFWLLLPAHAQPPTHPLSALPPGAAVKVSPGGVTGEAGVAPLIFPVNPLLAPAGGDTVDTFWPTFDWADAADPNQVVVSYTLLIETSLAQTISVTTTDSIYTPATALSNGVYTWTVQAHADACNASGYVTPSSTFTVTATWRAYLPLIFKPEPSRCPTASSAQFALIPIDGAPADHPDYLHGDLNLALRGYEATGGFLGLVNYSGSTDPGAPQLAGLFEPNRFPGISAAYQVYSWNWACGPHGCPGPLITAPPVTLTSLNTTHGEPIFIPERSPNIFGGDYKAMVLYAAENRITLAYTRRDTVASGYSVHLENICVDPNLLALYQAQTNADGWHVTGQLPALKNNQALGTALGGQMPLAIRDRGTFMDPRSRKDWWQGY